MNFMQNFFVFNITNSTSICRDSILNDVTAWTRQFHKRREQSLKNITIVIHSLLKAFFNSNLLEQVTTIRRSLLRKKINITRSVSEREKKEAALYDYRRQFINRSQK